MIENCQKFDSAILVLLGFDLPLANRKCIYVSLYARMSSVCMNTYIQLSILLQFLLYVLCIQIDFLCYNLYIYFFRFFLAPFPEYILMQNAIYVEGIAFPLKMANLNVAQARQRLEAFHKVGAD